MERSWLRGDQVGGIDSSVVIADDVEIGEGAKIHPNVVIYPGVTIDKDVEIFASSVIGRPPRGVGIVPPKEYIERTFIGRGSVIGSNVTIYAGCDLAYNVLIGDGVRIRENTRIGNESVIGFNATIQNAVEIGQRVRVLDLSHVTAATVIEDDVFWSVNVISMNDNRFAHGAELAPPRVEQGAMLGGGAVLLPGVEVRSGAMVGAGSVVTKNVDARTVVRGVPARLSGFAGSYFPASNEEGLLTRE
jgi:acetyltransferase-like isoleucine patch superfamily enzyme